MSKSLNRIENKINLSLLNRRVPHKLFFAYKNRVEDTLRGSVMYTDKKSYGMKGIENSVSFIHLLKAKNYILQKNHIALNAFQ